MSKVITQEAIASYPQLAEPDKKGKYGITVIFLDEADCKPLKKAALATLQEKYGDKLKGAKLVSLDTEHGMANFIRTPGGETYRLPWREDADVLATKGYPEGSVFISARTESRPGVVSGAGCEREADRHRAWRNLRWSHREDLGGPVLLRRGRKQGRDVRSRQRPIHS